MNKITKIAGGFGLMFALVLAMFIAVPQTKAATYPDILVGSDMTLGSTGQGVVILQGLMSELGYLSVPVSVPLGYYGTLTKNAVARYQSSLGVSPAVGYFGPVSKTAMHADFAPHGWLNLLGW